MGILLSCCRPEIDEVNPVDVAIRRQQMAEAAEKRRQEDEKRGLKSQAAAEKLKKEKTKPLTEEPANTNNEGGLKWQVD